MIWIGSFGYGVAPLLNHELALESRILDARPKPRDPTSALATPTGSIARLKNWIRESDSRNSGSGLPDEVTRPALSRGPFQRNLMTTHRSSAHAEHDAPSPHHFSAAFADIRGM
jgi:hypothetical protein